MTHIVTDNCQKCRYTECVSVCPVECFHVGDDMVYIDPELCIDCGGCIPACPVNAIYDTVTMPAQYQPWIAINKEQAAALPIISAPMPSLPGADEKRAALGL